MMKHLSIATVTVGMLMASMTGAIAEEPADPTAGVPAPAQAGATTEAEENGNGMGGDMMKQKKEKMKEMKEKMKEKKEK